MHLLKSANVFYAANQSLVIRTDHIVHMDATGITLCVLNQVVHVIAMLHSCQHVPQLAPTGGRGGGACLPGLSTGDYCSCETFTLYTYGLHHHMVCCFLQGRRSCFSSASMKNSSVTHTSVTFTAVQSGCNE